ncbi:MAG: PilT/PilU family type 4a pilus ATPase [Lachnospiraceae bacterium]|nr:PilT/PilU family type 4a pilus ATPase [Lachnospiraceae bacterium]
MTLEELLILASEKRATDVHLTVGMSPRCRVNGELVELISGKMDSEGILKLIQPLFNPEIESKLNEIYEADFSYSVPQVGRFRVNVFKQRGNLAIAIRLFPNEIPTPKELKLPDGIVELMEQKRGLTLVTGPTGGGKTTTVASLINVINHTQSVHVITIEDPIEYLYRHDKAMVNQREVGIDTGSYKDALSAALRENTDVIFVGELDNYETVTLALMAAETGHMVISTMHTVDTVSTLNRIVDMFPPHNRVQLLIQLGNVLNAVICQQLLTNAQGRERVAAFEVMYNTPEIRKLLREDKIAQIPGVMKRSNRMGMQIMDDAVYNLYLKQEIDEETMKKYSGGQ